MAGGRRRPLVGRDTEVAALTAHLSAPEARVAVLLGEAGVGKTALLGALRPRLDGLVLSLAADPLTALSADAGLCDLYAPLAEELPPPEDGEGWRAALLAHTLELLDGATRSGPVTLVIDDAHHAGELLWRHLRIGLRRLADRPLRVLLASRPAEPGAEGLLRWLAELGHIPLLPLHLGGLDTAAVEELATAVLGGPPGPRLRTLLAGVGGNPLYVVVLLEGLAAGGKLTTTEDGVVDTTTVGLPPSLQLLLLGRIAALGAETAELLRAAAVLGEQSRGEDVAALAAIPPEVAIPRLARAVDAGLLSAAAERVVFRHALVREALLADTPAVVRRALHRRAAALLAERGAPPTVLAYHLDAAADGPDAAAAEALTAAARLLVSADPERAVVLCRRALALTPAGASPVPTYTVLITATASCQGPVELDRTITEALAACPEATDRDQLRAAAGSALVVQGRIADALRSSREVVGRVSDRAALGVRASLATAELLTGDVEAAQRTASAVLTSRTRGRGRATAYATATLAWCRTFAGELDVGVALAREALAHIGDRPGHLWLRAMAGLCLDRADEVAEARRVVAVDTQRATSPDAVGALAVSGLLAFHAGDWTAAREALDRARTLAEDLGVTPLVGTLWPWGARAILALECDGSTGAARHEVDEGLAAAERGGVAVARDWLRWAAALVAEAEGDPASAWMLLGDAVATDRAHGLVSELVLIAPWAARAALAAGDREAAVALAAELDALPPRTPTWAAVRRHTTALAAGDPEGLVAAVATYRRAPRPLWYARACEDAAAAGAEDAVGLLTAAEGVYRRLGAELSLARVRAALRAQGVRRRGHRSDAPLTPAETRVVALVAEGLTNREIATRLHVSPRTVGSHVSAALRKLGCRTRAELAAWYAAQLDHAE